MSTNNNATIVYMSVYFHVILLLCIYLNSMLKMYNYLIAVTNDKLLAALKH